MLEVECLTTEDKKKRSKLTEDGKNEQSHG
jgi:hypothetical protein